MSTTIDQRVVEMQFDNRQFERNVQTSLSTLDKLKQSLNLTGAAKGFEDIDSASRRVNFAGLSGAVETVGLKFNAMYTIADQALRNITNSAMNAGKRIVSALTIDPIKTGFAEYETQINAVQTILANTSSKGTTITDVNAALDQLNAYADKTIYNFTEMTRNIGTFTAAGIDLDASVSSIQGIANLAAVSGSTSQQASTAMYQLSQALSSGAVKLQDWNSVVNAGMGGQVFQDALKRTATVMGTDVDALIEKAGSFRESLKEGWITSDVLNETLRQFTMAAEEGSAEWDNFKKSLMDDGYTEKQAIEILKMANTATDAATKVKTFTQLWDTLKEAAQSGWTQTWEIIVGDFEEAKALLTTVSDVIGEMINKSSEARNKVLQGWKDAGGRTMLIESLSNVFKGLMAIVKPIGEAIKEIFPPVTVDQLMSFTEGFKNLTEKFVIGEKTANNIKRTFKGVFALVDIGVQVVKALVTGFAKLVGVVLPVGGGLLSVTATIGDFIVGIDKALKSSDIFGKIIETIGKILKPFADGIKAIGKTIGGTFDEVSESAERRLGPLQTLGEALKKAFTGVADVIGKVFPIFSKLASNIGNMINDALGAITSSVANADYNPLFDMLNGGIFAAIGVFIAKFVKNAGDLVGEGGGFLESIQDILGGASDALGAFTSSLKAKALKEIAIAIAILAGSLLVLSLINPEKMTTSLAGITALFAELFAAMSLFTKMADGKKMRNLAVLTKTMISMSAALLVLSVAMKIMSTMSWSEMGVGLVSVSVGLGVLIGALRLLPKDKVNSSAKVIKKLASALIIFAIAMKILGSLSWGEMAVGLTATVIGLGTLVGALHLLPKNMSGKTAGMLVMATSLVVLGSALKIMGSLSWAELARGLTSVAVGLGAFVLALRLLPKDAAIRAIGVSIMASAMVILASAIKSMGSLSLKEIAKGLATLAGSLIIIAAAMALMKNALPGAAALLVVSGALNLLVPVLQKLGSMSWKQIVKGLGTLAAAFAVVGISVALLQPLIPTIVALSLAITLFGVACVAIGAGTLAFGVGLSTLAAALSASGVAIVAFVSSIIGLIPYLIEQIGQGIIRLCNVISNSASAICKAVTVIVRAIVDAILDCVPTVAKGLFKLIDSLLNLLIKNTPTIVNKLFDFLIGLINAISQRLPDLIAAGIDLLMSFFGGVLSALEDVDPKLLMDGIFATGLLAALVAALAAIAGLIPAAMVGTIGLGMVLAELAVVLGLIGTLAQLPGLDWLIDEGGELLENIGIAIGRFVGGIAGGIASGVTASFPKIGTNLSDFMTNVKPFIEGAKAIDASSMNGVKSLVEVLLALTAANVVDGLTSWITGGSSLKKFGEDIAALAPNLKVYADTVKGIDASAITSSANAAKVLSELATNLPNSGGLVGWFAGENDIGDFGEQLVPFGKGMKAYSDSIVGFNSEAVISSANAAKALAVMASYIPNQGGLVAWFTGDNSIVKFSAELVMLGQGLKLYSDSIVGFNAESVMASANAARALAEMTQCIPNEGGMIAWFAGENSISSFAAELPILGVGLKGFSDSVAGINAENVNAATSAAKALAQMANTIPNEGGIVAWFTGEQSITKFAGELPKLGEGLLGFSNSVAGINAENITAASNAAKALAEMTSYIPNEGGITAWFTGEKSISKFAGDLSALGGGIKGFSDSVTGINGENVTVAANAAKAIAEMTKVIPTEGGITAWFAGEQSISKFSGDLPKLGEGLKGFSDAVTGINAENITAAANAAKTIAEMTNVIPSSDGVTQWFTGEKSISKFSGELKKLGTGIKGFSDAVTGIVPENVKSAASAAKWLAEMAKTAPQSTDHIVSFGANLSAFGGHLGSYFMATKGISSDGIRISATAVQSLKNITDLDSSKITAVSDSLNNLVESFNKLSNISDQTSTKFIAAMQNISNSEMVKKGLEELNNAMKSGGEAAMDKLGEGITNRETKLRTTVKQIALACAKVINGTYDSFKSAGKNLVSGFADGITANTWKAEAKARAMANAAEKAAKNALDINSPSKVFRAIGYSVPEGFAMGIDKMTGLVKTSVGDMGSTAVKGIKRSLNNLSDLVNSDIDSQPTIRPVLDLTDVEKGASTIGSIFGTPSVATASSIRSISAMMNLQNQNGINGDIVDAINRLRTDIGKTGNTSYNLNGLTYNEGSDVAEAFKTIIRAATRERRV